MQLDAMRLISWWNGTYEKMAGSMYGRTTSSIFGYKFQFMNFIVFFDILCIMTVGENWLIIDFKICLNLSTNIADLSHKLDRRRTRLPHVQLCHFLQLTIPYVSILICCWCQAVSCCALNSNTIKSTLGIGFVAIKKSLFFTIRMATPKAYPVSRSVHHCR